MSLLNHIPNFDGPDISTRSNSNEDKDSTNKKNNSECYIMCLENFSIQNINNIKFTTSRTSSSNDIECLHSQINNCPIKERLVLQTLLKLKEDDLKENQEILTYNSINNEKKLNDIIDNNNNECDININEDNKFNLDYSIFNAINRVVHKTLHKNRQINGKETKICEFFEDLTKANFKENEHINYSNIDKLVCNLKKKDKNLEFAAIKAIIIAMINISGEMIKNYIKKSKDNMKSLNKTLFMGQEDEAIIELFDPYIFKSIYNDFVFTCNMCPFLENYFIESFNCFRQKYQMSFTLSELFTDIFWDCVFHNKILCYKFISLYIGNDNCCEEIRKILKKIIKIISDSTIPLKHQICELLLINQISDKNYIDLITNIIELKNENHNLIVKDEINDIINNSINKSIITSDSQNNHIYDINEFNKNENDDKKDISVNNKNIINEDIKEEESNKNKDVNNNIIGNLETNNNTNNDEIDLEHKSVDELFNYINEDKEKKTKNKKRRVRKKKSKKNEIQNNNNSNNNNSNINNNEKNIVEENIEEDQVVLQFKKYLNENFIFANSINKIKPNISEEWIKLISEYK